MSYQALYRKFRPQEFEDVKGQEHIVTTLKNQIKADSRDISPPTTKQQKLVILNSDIMKLPIIE